MIWSDRRHRASLPGTTLNTPTKRTKLVLDNLILKMNVTWYISNCALLNVDKFGVNYMIKYSTVLTVQRKNGVKEAQF